jgi:hypothetical protein
MPADTFSPRDWNISKIEDLAPPLRRVLLFGSFGQLGSYLTCVAVVLLPVLLYVDAQVAGVLGIGALCGSLPAVLATLPARMTVQIGVTPTIDAVDHHLETQLRSMGYAPHRDGAVRRFSLKRNWWACWRESDFHVTHLPDRIVVAGPRGPLTQLRRSIEVWLAI